MTIQQTTARLVATALQERIRSGAVRFGLLARNLPPFDGTTLCEELRPALVRGVVRLALIGFAAVNAPQESEIITTIEQAVAWRNDPNNKVPLVVLLNSQQAQEKVHSLEMFDTFEDVDLHRAVCKQGMKGSHPHYKLLWEVLRRSDILQSIPLTAVQTVAYYDALQRGETYGEALPHLGLLPDPALSWYALERGTLIRRLRENRRYVQYLLSLDKTDYRVMSSTFDKDRLDRYRHTFLSVQAYTQYPAIDNLKRLTLEDVEALFDLSEMLTDPQTPSNQPASSAHMKVQVASLDSYIVERLLQGIYGQRQCIAAFAYNEKQRFREDANGDRDTSPISVTQLPAGRNLFDELGTSAPGDEHIPAFRQPRGKQVKHPLEVAMRLWVQTNNWGGIIRVSRSSDSEAPLTELLEDAMALQFLPFQPIVTSDESERDEGRLMALFKGLESMMSPSEIEEDNLAELLAELHSYRAELAAYRTLFLYHPITATADSQLFHALDDYIRTYERLANRLKRLYPRAEERCPEAIEEAASLFLALDTVILDRPQREAVILTTLHPLRLWRWLELANRIRSNTETLKRDEQMAIVEKSGYLPTALTAFLLHSRMLSGSRHLAETRLVLAGEISNPAVEGTVGIPYYERTARHPGTCAGLDQLPDLLRNFLALYPPARIGLAMVLIDPPILTPIFNMLATLHVQEYDREPLLQGARITIYRTRPEAMADSPRSQADSEALTLFRTDPRWTLQISTLYADYEEICSVIEQSSPHHIILLCNPSVDIAQPIPRAFQGRPSPLSVPLQVSYDAICDSVRLVRSCSDGIFEAYTGLRTSLAGELHRLTFGLESRCALTEQCLKVLSSASQWLIVVDRPYSSPMAFASTGQCLLRRSSGMHTLTVYTQDRPRIRKHLVDHLRCVSTKCDPEFIEQYLAEVSILYPEGLLSTVCTPPARLYEATHEAFRPSSIQGLLGVIALLHWYRQDNPGVVLVNIAFDRFHDWFDQQKRPPSEGVAYLLALWCRQEILHADVIAVHSREIPPSVSEAKLHLDWLECFAKTLEELFTPQADNTLLTPFRRELLRVVLCTGVFFAPSRHSSPQGHTLQAQVRSEWATAINRLFTAYCPSIRLRSAWIALHQTGEPRIQMLVSSSYPRDTVTLTGKLMRASIQTTGLPFEEAPLTHADSTQTGRLRDKRLLSRPSLSRAVENSEGFEETSPRIQGAHFGEDLCEEVNRQAEGLRRVLENYGFVVAEVDTKRTQVGPSLLRYWIKLKPPGGRLAEVQKCAVDLARELGCRSVPFIDNIPGQPYISIDLPREQTIAVPLAPVLTALPPAGPSTLRIVVGRDLAGNDVQLDLAHLPHILVCGTQWGEIRMLLAGFIASLVQRHAGSDLKLLLKCTKLDDFASFSSLPHLHEGQVLHEASEVFLAFQTWIASEIDHRKSLLLSENCPNIPEYNRRNPRRCIPWIVVVIDELADLALALSTDERQTLERQIALLVATRQSLGIHLVLSTSYSAAGILPESIKAAMTTRIVFRMPSAIESRAILGRSGAEYLLGQGDMLVCQKGEIQRLQGYSVSDGDWENLL